jgi:hypothetical protein
LCACGWRGVFPEHLRVTDDEYWLEGLPLLIAPEADDEMTTVI